MPFLKANYNQVPAFEAILVKIYWSECLFVKNNDIQTIFSSRWQGYCITESKYFVKNSL